MNPELFEETTTFIESSDCIIQFNTDIVIITDWESLGLRLNNTLKSIDAVWFSNKLKGLSDLPIAIRGKSKLPNIINGYHDSIDYVLVSPPIEIYYELFDSCRKVNTVLANSIGKVLRKRAKVLNEKTGLSNIYRPWFVRTVIENIEG